MQRFPRCIQTGSKLRPVRFRSPLKLGLSGPQCASVASTQMHISRVQGNQGAALAPGPCWSPQHPQGLSCQSQKPNPAPWAKGPNQCRKFQGFQGLGGVLTSSVCQTAWQTNNTHAKPGLDAFPCCLTETCPATRHAQTAAEVPIQVCPETEPRQGCPHLSQARSRQSVKPSA